MKPANMIGALAIVLSSALTSASAGAAEKLGRLFLTPERRHQLEQQREYNLQEQRTLEGSTVKLDGVVVRSSGKKTVWINGQQQHDNRNDLGVATDVSRRDPGQAKITDGTSNPTRLRVGQEINRATQEIHDGLDGGRVDVKPARR